MADEKERTVVDVPEEKKRVYGVIKKPGDVIKSRDELELRDSTKKEKAEPIETEQSLKEELENAADSLPKERISEKIANSHKETDKKRNRGLNGFAVLVSVLVVIGIGSYVFFINRDRSNNPSESLTDQQRLIEYDFENDYPKTPREVVKLHCKYLKFAYNNLFEEDDLPKVNTAIRNLFDEQLLEVNGEAAQLEGLKREIASYQEEKKRIVGYTLPESSQIDQVEKDGDEYANLPITLVISVKGKNVDVNEQYILKKDSEGRWKIVGWTITQ